MPAQGYIRKTRRGQSRKTSVDDEKEIGNQLDAEAEVQEDDFDIDAELEKPCVSKTVDVWMLGRHRVICGDSTQPETYDILMDDKRTARCVRGLL